MICWMVAEIWAYGCVDQLVALIATETALNDTHVSSTGINVASIGLLLVKCSPISLPFNDNALDKEQGVASVWLYPNNCYVIISLRLEVD